MDKDLSGAASKNVFTLRLFIVHTSDYTYVLPADKIAIYPLAQRDSSKLLVYKKGVISHSVFSSLAEHLPSNAFLFFNDTRVIPARLHFRKETGAVIEVFLLNPIRPSSLISETMASTRRCSWHCTIGNLKKWPEGTTLSKAMQGLVLHASLKDRKNNIVEFIWETDESFAEIIRRAGETPLPPYIKRPPDKNDQQRYQTVYSHYDGAVAAPTAGLHFTPAVLEKLGEKDIARDFLTLHVSAGTFQPIKTEEAEKHEMHEEQIIVSRGNVQNLLTPGRLITAVGTTSMRTLESLYWFGARLTHDPDDEFRITQEDPYTFSNPPAPSTALKAVAHYMDTRSIDHLIGETSIYIRPGYSFKICNALITNFHQPASTLILLVAAFVGDDWRKIYDEALRNDYRFLSYGDSSLLIP